MPIVRVDPRDGTREPVMTWWGGHPYRRHAPPHDKRYGFAPRHL